jgi:hypothetical protein
MRIRPVLVVTGSALLLTACGSSPLEGKNGTEVAAAAADALEEAGAVHATGTMTMDGDEGEIDLQLQGDDAAGTVSLGGADLELISLDGTAYMKGSPDFWAMSGLPEEAAATFDGQWVIVPGDAAGGFTDFSLAGFVEELRNPTDSDIKDEVESDEVDGQDVVVVEQENGSTIKVADDDPSYPLEMTSKGDSEGTVTFSGFGEEEEISAPADAVKLEELVASLGG